MAFALRSEQGHRCAMRFCDCRSRVWWKSCRARGYRIKPISVADAAEMYEMRGILERACVTRAVEQAPDAALQDLDRFRKSGKTPDLPSWIAYNKGVSRGPWPRRQAMRGLSRAARDIIEEFDRLTYMSIARFEIGALSELVAEHGELIDALQARDQRAALAIARNHLDEARDRLLDSLSNLAVVP